MKRRLLIIAIFLLLGAVVNVAVAWGCFVSVDSVFDTKPLSITEGDIEWWRKHFPAELPGVPLSITEGDVEWWRRQFPAEFPGEPSHYNISSALGYVGGHTRCPSRKPPGRVVCHSQGSIRSRRTDMRARVPFFSPTQTAGHVDGGLAATLQPATMA